MQYFDKRVLGKKVYRCLQTAVAPAARELDRAIHIFNLSAAPEYSQTEREEL